MQTWTHQTMYTRPDAWSDRPPQMDLAKLAGRVRRNGHHRFTPEFAAAILAEKEWQRIDAERPDLPEELRQPVGMGETPCPYCQGARNYPVTMRGVTSGILIRQLVRCICCMHREFWRIWRDVPARFRDVRLETLDVECQQVVPIES